MNTVPSTAVFHAFASETAPQVVAVCNRQPGNRARVARALRRHGGKVHWTSHRGAFWGVATAADLT